jgi:hypothetical protein
VPLLRVGKGIHCSFMLEESKISEEGQRQGDGLIAKIMNFSCAEMNMQKIPSAVVHLIVALIYI